MSVAEDPVHPTGVEAQRPEPLLDLRHVVASKHGGSQVEETVTDAESRLHQGVPRLATTDAVDAQPAAVLKCLHRDPGGQPEGSLGISRGVETGAREATLHVGHGSPDIVLAKREDVVGQDGQR